MTRRDSSAPWSRPLLTGFALAGAAITGYLTIVKISGGNAACPTEGCETVLNSSYGEVAGLPLALFGLGAYLLVAILALLPRLFRDASSDESERDWPERNWQGRTWTGLFWLTTAMAVFSGYLIYVLVTDLQVLCLYCIASAALSLSLWLTTLLGKRWEDWGKLSFDGIIVALLVSFAAVAINGTSPSLASDAPSGGGYGGAAIATTATPDNIALAQHLNGSGAKMYGAYWCSHCHDQKALFGAEALADLPYVECDAKGINAQPDQCKTAKVDGYPTWVINGQVLSGTQDLADLADASGYDGPRNFSPAS